MKKRLKNPCFISQKSLFRLSKCFHLILKTYAIFFTKLLSYFSHFSLWQFKATFILLSYTSTLSNLKINDIPLLILYAFFFPIFQQTNVFKCNFSIISYKYQIHLASLEIYGGINDCHSCFFDHSTYFLLKLTSDWEQIVSLFFFCFKFKIHFLLKLSTRKTKKLR